MTHWFIIHCQTHGLHQVFVVHRMGSAHGGGSGGSFLALLPLVLFCWRVFNINWRESRSIPQWSSPLFVYFIHLGIDHLLHWYLQHPAWLAEYPAEQRAVQDMHKGCSLACSGTTCQSQFTRKLMKKWHTPPTDPPIEGDPKYCEISFICSMNDYPGSHQARDAQVKIRYLPRSRSQHCYPMALQVASLGMDP